MANNLGTFDFKKLSVIIGVAQITGFADGDSVEITEENDVFNSVGGADGYVDRVKNNANFLNVILRLRQTSPTNQILSGIHNADRAVSATLPLLIKDRSGNTLIAAKNAWIVKNPSIAYGNEAKQREWTIKTGSDYVVNLAGND
jgi:hypothetical protein